MTVLTLKKKPSFIDTVCYCKGARVILACRDMTRAHIAADEIRQRSGNGNVVVKKLDLASLQSVRDLAKDVSENEARLDILINNAGILQQLLGATIES